MDEKDKKWQSPIVHDLVTLYLMNINKKNHKEKEHAPLKEKLSEEKHTTNTSDFSSFMNIVS